MLRDRNIHKIKAIIGNIIKELINFSSLYLFPIVVENLDFDLNKIMHKDKDIKIWN